ncbi:MAG: biotin synthase BioB, partial [Actinomycetota bacterium]
MLLELGERLASGGEALSFDEAVALCGLPDTEVPDLVAVAHRVRLARCGAEVELESIVSAKTGGCPEDCAFCSQSRRWDSPVRPEPFIDIDRLVEAARRSQEMGATEFCIVLAVRGPDERIMDGVLDAVRALQRETDLRVAASVGILTREQAEAFLRAGVHRYNHNLEAARSFFPQICTTHTWEDRRDTCLVVKEVGMELCSGGIMGLGETARQRVELAFELAELGPREVPINFLNPRPGTPLEKRGLLRP